jgi:hypothetical protein
VDPLTSFWEALEARHLRVLTFQEVRRALTALSSLYVERRDKLPGGAVFDGAGKRAAFALFYGPMHFAVVTEIVHQLGASASRTVADLGCGTGVCGAAWALGTRSPVQGFDVNAWAVDEARFTYGHFGLEAAVHKSDVARARWPDGASIICGYTANELDERGRASLLERLLSAARSGSAVMVIEPIAKRDRPWWPDWQAAFAAAGGRADEWRLRVEMPERWRLLDKAAGLRHHELTARSLYLPGQGA